MKERSDSNFRLGQQIVAPLVCGVIGFSLGALVWRSGSQPEPKLQPQVAVTTSNIPTSPVRSAAIKPLPPMTSQSAFQRLEAMVSTPSVDGRFNVLEAIRLSSELSIDEIKNVHRNLGRLSNSARQVVMEALAQRWAGIDPIDAFNHARRETQDGWWRDRLGVAASTILAARDPESALDLISQAPSRAVQQKIGEWVLPVIAKANPARAAAYLASTKMFSGSGEVYGMIAQHYGRSSPHEAIAWANALPNENASAKHMALKMAWFGWAETNPQEVAATITRDGAKGVDHDVFQAITATWSRTDPFAALQWTETLPQGRARDEAQSALRGGIGDLSHDDARRMIESVSSEKIRHEMAQQFAKKFAQANVSEGLAWAEQLPEGSVRSQAFGSVIQQWALEDPAGAARYAAGQANSREGLNLFAKAYGEWVQSEPEAAFAYGQALPAGKQRDAATATAVNAIRDEDPQKALKWYRSIENPDAAKAIAEGLLGSLVKSDPAAAIQFANEIPAEAQPKAYHNLVRSWAFGQPEQAGEWVKMLTPGTARDSAVEAYVSVIDGMDAGTAAKWANTITDPKKRIENTAGMVQRWMQTDHAAASAWVQSTEFPPDVRQGLERFLQASQETRRDRD